MTKVLNGRARGRTEGYIIPKKRGIKVYKAQIIDLKKCTYILSGDYETNSHQALTCNIKATFTASFMALQT